MADASSEPAITVNIKGPSEMRLTMTVDGDATVKQLKEEIARQKEDVPVECQRLIYAGKVLKDEQLLSEYKLQNNHTVHLVKSASRSAPSTGNPTMTATPSAARPPPSAPSAAGAPQPTTTTTTTASPTPAAASAAHGVPSNFGAGQQFANNPLAALNRADLAGPHMANLGRNMFQGAGMNPADPNMMMNALDSPEFQSHMRSMLRRPEVIDQMIAMNPQMAGMGPQLRQMMQSDQFVDMMTNPDTMRRMIQLQTAMGGGAGGAGGLGALGPLGGLGDGQQQQQQQQWPPPGAFGTPSGSAQAGDQQRAGSQGAAGAAAENPFAALAALGGFGGAAAGGRAGQTDTERAENLLTNPLLRDLLGAGMGGGLGGGPTAGVDLFGGLGVGGSFGSGATAGGVGSGTSGTNSLPPPEERYASQLQSLRDMGFIDGPANLRALLISGGSVEGAISILLGGN